MLVFLWNTCAANDLLFMIINTKIIAIYHNEIHSFITHVKILVEKVSKLNKLQCHFKKEKLEYQDQKGLLFIFYIFCTIVIINRQCR